MKDPKVSMTFRLNPRKKEEFEKKANKESSPSEVLRKFVDEYITGDNKPRNRG